MTESFFKNEPEEEPQGEPREIPDLNDQSPGRDESGGAGERGFATEEGRTAAIMAYIPILCFVPLLNMRDNKEARFHARQGVMLFLIELVAVLFLVDGVSDFVFRAILILAIALSVAGIILALQGKSYRLPLIGDLADKTKL